MKKLFKRVLSDFSAHGCVTHGAALAFYALFVLIPIPIFVVALAAGLIGDDLARSEIVQVLRALAGAQLAETLSQALATAGQLTSWRGANLFGLASMIFGSTAFFGELQETLNKIWRAPTGSLGWRSLVRSRLVSFAMVAASGAALLILIVTSALTREFGEKLKDILPLPMILSRIEGQLLSLVVITVLFALVFRFVPDVDISFREVWLGSLLTALLFFVGKEMLGLFLRQTHLASAYGAAGSLVLTLTWIYYSAIAFLLGAELTRALARPSP